MRIKWLLTFYTVYTRMGGLAPGSREAVLDRRYRMDRAGGQSLLDAQPYTQWLHSLYFVLTTMTTVGFGDITPQTDAEVPSSSLLCFNLQRLAQMRLRSGVCFLGGDARIILHVGVFSSSAR